MHGMEYPSNIPSSSFLKKKKKGKRGNRKKKSSIENSASSAATTASSQQQRELILQQKENQQKSRRKFAKVHQKDQNEMEIDGKYYGQRFRLFSKYDEGVMLDKVAWYSVCPEEIAVHTAKRCQFDIVIDAFCGIGGNAIQFARTCKRVIAIDIDPIRLACARHNAKVYGVADKIDFILGNFMTLAGGLKADAIFLAPPWGGPEYLDAETFDIETMIPMNGIELFKLAQAITPNIIYQLPRNIDHVQVSNLAHVAPPKNQLVDGKKEWWHGMCEIEANMLSGKVKMLTAYYGQLVSRSLASRE